MDRSKPIRVVVLGGGTAGWMSAAALVSVLPAHRINVTLIESEAIGIIGVGEATLPHLRHFNETIGIDETDFIRATSATMKLGIEFVNWGRRGDRYIHPFGDFGRPVDGIPFHQAWARLQRQRPGPAIGKYSLPIRMCESARFGRPSEDFDDICSTYGYAYQFDATQYAPFLRRHAEARGATRIEGIVNAVNRNPESGDIEALVLEDGQCIAGDLFLDCTGFGGVLIERTLEAGYEDWSNWLPCDRAIALPCSSSGPLLPYTRATAHEAGWQWRIPLQHRTGNGHVYASGFTDDATAEARLLDHIDGTPLADPRRLRFTTGRRRSFWAKNCVAIGLAGGFLEPLESTSIHLTQVAITHLIELFPNGGNADVERQSYNAIMAREFERVRDFLILHYHATERDDSDFWNHVRTMSIPDTLQEKMALFRARGRIATYGQGLFLEPSWVAVYLGQRVRPAAEDARLDQLDPDRLATWADALEAEISTAVTTRPDHAAWLAQAQSAPAGTAS